MRAAPAHGSPCVSTEQFGDHLHVITSITHAAEGLTRHSCIEIRSGAGEGTLLFTNFFSKITEVLIFQA